MIEFETFKSNLDIEDKQGVKDCSADKTLNYR